MRKKLFIVGISLLLFFALFSKSVKRGALSNVDFSTTVRIQDKVASILKSPSRIERFDEIMEDVGFFASPGFSVVVIGLISLTGFIKENNWRKKIRILIIPLLFGLLVVGELYGKSVVHHPAPPFFMLKNPTTIFPTYYINEEFSYPSGHAARAVFLGILIVSMCQSIPSERLRAGKVSKQKKSLVRTWSVLFAVIYIGIVSMSRVYLGHHWLSDVIGGLLLGSGFAIGTLGLEMVDI